MSSKTGIAITGIGCRFPGDISSPSQLWDFLAVGGCAASKVPQSRFNVDAYHGSKDEGATTVAAGGYFLRDDIRNFDNEFFGIHNREAADMDPQQRKLLEVVYECFESAGVTLDEVSGSNIGCYVAQFTSDFAAMQAKDAESMGRYTYVGMAAAILANRISHVFNLQGPSCAIDTACSSSFYALHMACSALKNGECDAAVVAGVNLIQTPEVCVATSQGGFLSPSSTCKTFDATADGYGRADGVGAIYLKRVDDALRDQDVIRSVIRATAVNSNGRTPGISQPSVDGQEAVIRKAYAQAGLDPAETVYVEAHGTGTNVGDPVEVEAISRVFRKDQRPRPTLIGSVKPNLGHGEASSGLLSLIKACLALERCQIPATVSVKQMNPNIQAAERGIEVVTRTTPFPSFGGPRRVSVNCFGFGGANAHGIVEEAGPQANAVSCRRGTRDGGHVGGPSSTPYLLPFSANKLPSLQGRVDGLSQLSASAISIADLAYTLGERRSHLPVRGYIIARQESLAQDLRVDNLRMSDSDSSNLRDSNFAFVFTGQGAQWAGMARQLLQFPAFAGIIRQLDDELSSLPHAPDWKIQDVLGGTSEIGSLDQAALAQPITTAVQIGLVVMLRSWSIMPQGVIGHSSGEIAAAYAAGLLTAREAIVIAYYRGYAVSRSRAEGAMAAVGLDCDDAAQWITRLGLGTSIQVACINSPESVTLSGDRAGIDTMLASLQARGIFARKLKTDGRAYHSHHMAAIGAEYQDLLQEALPSLERGSSDVRHDHAQMYSTVLCQEAHAETVRQARYWRQNLESPVRFCEGITALSRMLDPCTFVELGPHAALKLPIMQTVGTSTSYLATLNRGQDSAVCLLDFLGRLFVQGLGVRFANLTQTYDHATPRFIYDLPTYAWHYDPPPWNESRVSREWRNVAHPRHELLGREVPGGNQRTFGWRNLLRLEAVPWLGDHKLGDTVIFPATAYIAMAVEALLQKTIPRGGGHGAQSVVLRSVNLLKALAIPDQGSIELYTELRAETISNTRDSPAWWEFQISSVSEEGPTTRAKGSIRLETSGASSAPVPSSKSRLAAQSRKLWYESLASGGLLYGSNFQHMHEVYTPEPKGELFAEARTRTLATATDGIQSNPRYLIHPVLLDNVFQVALIASTGGYIQSMAAKVPVRIRHARISPPPSPADAGTIRAVARVTGQYSNSFDSVLADASQRPVAEFRDVDMTAYIGTAKLEVRNPIARVSYKPDINQVHDNATLSSALDHVLSISNLGSFGSKANVLAALDLIVHKNPDMDILCLADDPSLIAPALEEVFHAESTYRRFRSFSMGRVDPDGRLEIAEIHSYTLPLPWESLTYRSPSSGDQFGFVILGNTTAALSAVGPHIIDETFLVAHGLNRHFSPDNFSAITCDSDTTSGMTVLRPRPATNDLQRSPFEHLVLVGRSPSNPADERLRSHLSEDLGMPVKQVAITDLAGSSILPNLCVVSTVELERSILAGAVPEDEFNGFKWIIEHAACIVWITGSGAQNGFDPTLSLFTGLARAIIIEQPTTKIFSLEQDPTTDVATVSRNVARMLGQRPTSVIDSEYISNGPHLLISRIVPDERMNSEFRIRQNGIAAPMTLGDVGDVALSIHQPGQVNTAQFVPRTPSTGLAADHVRVKVSCVGLNAKDVYALAGRVQTRNAACCFEYTGQIVAIGSDVREFAVGDRVAVMYPGYLGTYERAPVWSCAKLLEGEDMRTMSTVLVVFATAIYALYDRARLQPGEKIIIHSAAGGVGIATIQLAQLIGAEIFATVGNEGKKQYLIDHFGLRADHIFNSRDATFAAKIMSVTAGHGVDVVLNSLVGELLHEGWECIAEFGRFVEIGKQDITESGRLRMNVFSRGATFTAFDLAMLSESTSPAQRRVWSSLIARVLTLLRAGDIQPVGPLSVFNVADMASAFYHFNSAKRIGKVALSFEDPAQMVPVVRPKFSTQLDPHKSYLLVGCLGGLGRSLSKWMLDRGARQFVFLGRSGLQRPAAQRLVNELEARGARCTVIQGDITSYQDVHRAVAAVPAPLGGVIQAAMGLNEAIFKHMPRAYWLNGTQAKVQGTWNLHNALAALERESELDFFLMTSSISGKLGMATESNYCAANNFLDTFARYRRHLGLTAVSLGLGMISEVGYLHENPHIEDLLLRKGIRSLTEDEVLQIFDFGLSQPPTSLHPKDLMPQPHILTGVEDTGLQNHRKQGYDGFWQLLNDTRFSLWISTLRHNSVRASQGIKTQASVIQDAIDSNDDAEHLTATVQEILVNKLSNMILTPAHKISHKTSLSDFGMDSMLASELRQYIFSTMGEDVPFLTLMDKKTNIGTLARAVAGMLRHRVGKPPS